MRTPSSPFRNCAASLFSSPPFRSPLLVCSITLTGLLTSSALMSGFRSQFFPFSFLFLLASFFPDTSLTSMLLPLMECWWVDSPPSTFQFEDGLTRRFPPLPCLGNPPPLHLAYWFRYDRLWQRAFSFFLAGLDLPLPLIILEWFPPLFPILPSQSVPFSFDGSPAHLGSFLGRRVPWPRMRRAFSPSLLIPSNLFFQKADFNLERGIYHFSLMLMQWSMSALPSPFFAFRPEWHPSSPKDEKAGFALQGLRICIYFRLLPLFLFHSHDPPTRLRHDH